MLQGLAACKPRTIATPDIAVVQQLKAPPLQSTGGPVVGRTAALGGVEGVHLCGRCTPEICTVRAQATVNHTVRANYLACAVATRGAVDQCGGAAPKLGRRPDEHLVELIDAAGQLVYLPNGGIQELAPLGF